MSQTCPSCGAACADDARFCGHCATPLQQSAPGTGRLPAQTVLQGRYIILKRIATGGMGAVYLAADERMAGKEWAIKEMSNLALGPTQQLAAREAFQQEARLLARLSHAQLPRVGDFFGEGGKYYLVMEYVRGETASALLARQGAIGEAVVLGWARQLCDVLAYLHQQQPPIIFRDIKPGNIMVTPQGEVKLIDFGIARHFRPGKTGDTQALGTPGYAAPEQYGRDQSDARTDIYGLGATLHHLLSGVDPALTPFQFVPLRSLDRDISLQTAQAIERAVQRAPEARFQSIAEMRAALLGPVSGVYGRPDASDGPVHPARNKRLVWSGLALFAALLIVAFVIRTVWPEPEAASPALVPPVVLAEGDSEGSAAPEDGAPEDGAPEVTAAALQPAAEPAATHTATATSESDDEATATATPTPPPPTRTEEAATPTAIPPTQTPAPPPLPAGAERIGYSHEGRNIEVYQYGDGPNSVVLVGGMHYGFAPSSVLITSHAMAHFKANSSDIPGSIRLYIIPNINPDGVIDPGYRPGRVNARGVDLNRNWDCNWRPDAEWDGQPISGGTTPFSEPETLAVRDFLLEVKPAAVIFYEARAADGMVVPGSCNGVYSGSDSLMHTYQRATNYRWLDGGSVTGDASNWAAREGMASIFVLLRSWDELPDTEWQRNLRGIQAVLAQYQ